VCPIAYNHADMQSLGYVFVADGGDLPARTESIRDWCAEQGAVLATVVHDADQHRPSLAWALEQIDAGRASVLVVTRLRDLCGDVRDLAPLLRWFLGGSRALVALDVGLDTSSDAGRSAADAIADLVMSVDEPDLASRRPGLGAAARGRAAVADVPALSERIAAMRAAGMTLQAIADVLNEDGVQTVRGGKLWRPSSVQRAAGYRRPSAPERGIELPKHVGQ
jgi:DNA invertase Pin-like site-specific DNA recombinase